MLWKSFQVALNRNLHYIGYSLSIDLNFDSFLLVFHVLHADF